MCIIVTIKPNKIVFYVQYAVWNFLMHVVQCGSCKQLFGQAENNNAIFYITCPLDVMEENTVSTFPTGKQNNNSLRKHLTT